MKERLPPDVFYYGFRHFLSGYTQGDFVQQGGIILEGKFLDYVLTFLLHNKYLIYKGKHI